MENNQELEEDISIDFTRVLKIINYRKALIAKVFLVCIVIFAIITLIIPKKYETNADLYINKSNNTNLAELNPYIISTMAGRDGMAGLLGVGNSGGLQNEIEIMQSPLVMDNVIKENDFKYTKGPRKGEYITTSSFLNKSLTIENKKGSNIISISYKSNDPLLSYNVVNSIIANYQKINEEINTKKAVKDKILLENSYESANKSLNKKLSAMKNSNTVPPAAANLGVLTVLKNYNRAVNNAFGSIQSQSVEGQKSQIAVDQELEKLKMIRSKLEWTNLVEQMSKDTSNVLILKHPELKQRFENSEPKLINNLILSVIFAIFVSVITVIRAEKADNSLTYSQLSKKVIYNIEKNIEELKFILLTNLKFNTLFVVFEGFQSDILKQLDKFNNFKVIKAEITPKFIDEIMSSDKVILAARIGQTQKKIYQQTKNICADAKKVVSVEII